MANAPLRTSMMISLFMALSSQRAGAAQRVPQGAQDILGIVTIEKGRIQIDFPARKNLQAGTLQGVVGGGTQEQFFDGPARGGGGFVGGTSGQNS